jgi:Domain of unknown function (DUF1707)
MTTDGWMRASDHDREIAAEVLGAAYAVGQLSRDELDQRTARPSRPGHGGSYAI